MDQYGPITPEQWAELQRMQKLAGGANASDPIQQYLRNLSSDHMRRAVDHTLAGGLKTTGGIGLMTTGGLPGFAFGIPMGMAGVADMAIGGGHYVDGRSARRGAQAFGQTGLPGRPAEEENLNPLMYYLDGQ